MIKKSGSLSLELHFRARDPRDGTWTWCESRGRRHRIAIALMDSVDIITESRDNVYK